MIVVFFSGIVTSFEEGPWAEMLLYKVFYICSKEKSLWIIELSYLVYRTGLSSILMNRFNLNKMLMYLIYISQVRPFS